MLIKYSDKPIARQTLFVHSILDSVFFPISIDFLFIPLLISKPEKAYSFAAIACVGSVLGSLFAYFLGLLFMNNVAMNIISALHLEHHWFDIANKSNSGISVWTLLIGAITPIPFSVASIASGVSGMNFFQFLIIITVGRVFRFFAISFVFRNYRIQYLKLKEQLKSVKVKKTKLPKTVHDTSP